MTPHSAPCVRPSSAVFFSGWSLCLLVALATGTLPLRPAWAQATCPEACLSLLSGSTCGSATSGDTTSSVIDGWGGRQCDASYDAVGGRISLTCYAGGSYVEAAGSVEVTDEYMIVGLPPGPPLTFQARLEATGNGRQYNNPQHESCNGHTWIGLRNAASDSSAHRFVDGTPSKTIVLTMTAAPGEPFALELFADGVVVSYNAGGSTHAEGQLSFGDLPDGATVVSCSGFRDDTPVAARRSTWGRLKAIYR